MLNVYDKTIVSVQINFYNDKKMHLSSIIMLKQEIIVELIEGNYAIEDGLVNYVDGIFKRYTKGNIDIVWIEFQMLHKR